MIKITSLHAAPDDSARVSQDFNDLLGSSLDLKEKNTFTEGYLGQSQTTPSFIHYSEVSDSRGGDEMSTKINKQVRCEESIYQVLLPSHHQAGHQPTNV